MDEEKFKRDLADGEQAEREVRALMLQKVLGSQDVIKVGRANQLHFDFTLVSDDGDFLVEVKFDKKREQTGNVAVEETCRGKFSGVTASESDYFVYKMVSAGRPGYFLIPTARLKTMVMNGPGRRLPGGDDDAVDMKLFKADFFERQCEFRLDWRPYGSIVLKKRVSDFDDMKP